MILDFSLLHCNEWKCKENPQYNTYSLTVWAKIKKVPKWGNPRMFFSKNVDFSLWGTCANTRIFSAYYTIHWENVHLFLKHIAAYFKMQFVFFFKSHLHMYFFPESKVRGIYGEHHSRLKMKKKLCIRCFTPTSGVKINGFFFNFFVTASSTIRNHMLLVLNNE